VVRKTGHLQISPIVGWIVELINSDFNSKEIFIQISCLLDQLKDEETSEICKVYDGAPQCEWRYLFTMQYKIYIRCRLTRINTSRSEVKTIQPNGASGYVKTL